MWHSCNCGEHTRQAWCPQKNATCFFLSKHTAQLRSSSLWETSLVDGMDAAAGGGIMGGGRGSMLLDCSSACAMAAALSCGGGIGTGKIEGAEAADCCLDGGSTSSTGTLAMDWGRCQCPGAVGGA